MLYLQHEVHMYTPCLHCSAQKHLPCSQLHLQLTPLCLGKLLLRQEQQWPGPESAEHPFINTDSLWCCVQFCHLAGASAVVHPLTRVLN